MITKEIQKFCPFNEQEAADKAQMLAFLAENPDAFRRENLPGHMTASAWIVNPRRDKVLMVWHNLYRSWSWTGGHADGQRDLLQVALKEAREETGLQHIRPVTEEVFSLEILAVDGHEKRGVYVPSHLHLNVTYLLEASEEEPLSICPEENSGVAWFSLEETLEKSNEPWFVDRIYKKLIAKLQSI